MRRSLALMKYKSMNYYMYPILFYKGREKTDQQLAERNNQKTNKLQSRQPLIHFL